jgi:hypothetical protein
LRFTHWTYSHCSIFHKAILLNKYCVINGLLHYKKEVFFIFISIIQLYYMRMINSTHYVNLAIDTRWIFYLFFMDSFNNSYLIRKISLFSLIHHSVGPSSDLLPKKICTRINSKYYLIFIWLLERKNYLLRR